jgi:hypothetical protein
MSEARRRLWLALLLCIGLLPFELNGWYNPRLSERGFWLAEIFAWIALPIAIVSIAVRMRLITLREIGLRADVRGQSPILLLPLTIVVSIVLYHVDRWAVNRAPVFFPTNYLALPGNYRDVVPPPGPATGWFRLLALLHLSLTAGVVEEIYHRGMFDQLFPRGVVGGIGFVLSSSLVFVSTHWEGGIYRMFEAAVFGLLASTILRLSRNLWPLMIAHMAIDFFWLNGS